MVSAHSLLSFLHICTLPASYTALLMSLSLYLQAAIPLPCWSQNPPSKQSSASSLIYYFFFQTLVYPAGVSLPKSQFQWWCPATILSQVPRCTSFLPLPPLVPSAPTFHWIVTKKLGLELHNINLLSFYFSVLSKRKDWFYSHLHKAHILRSDIWYFCWYWVSLHLTWATNTIHFHFWGIKAVKAL